MQERKRLGVFKAFEKGDYSELVKEHEALDPKQKRHYEILSPQLGDIARVNTAAIEANIVPFVAGLPASQALLDVCASAQPGALAPGTSSDPPVAMARSGIVEEPFALEPWEPRLLLVRSNSAVAPPHGPASLYNGPRAMRARHCPLLWLMFATSLA